jgi:hypothetical protein
MFLPDSSSWSSCQMLSSSTMVNFTRLITHAAPSTPVDRTREEGSREFRSRPAARPISRKTGAPTGFT